MSRRRFNRDWSGWIFVLGALVGAPITVSLLLSMGDWRIVAGAYAIWIAMLATWVLSGRLSEILKGRRSSTTTIEALSGWAMIIALFWTIPAIAAITIGLVLVRALF